MKLERSNVEHPLWRKKVDWSMFTQGTPIPAWACRIWDIPTHFKDCQSKNDPASKVVIALAGKKFTGWVTAARKGRKVPAYRLWFDDELCLKLKHTFLMTYMRSLEKQLDKNSSNDIEERIPFWEFLDIEFDTGCKSFKFVAHYRQVPTFPELFKRLIESPTLQKIDDDLSEKKPGRIYKQGWKPKEELDFEIGASNVVYMLIDTKNKLLYIGEAKDLVKRLSQKYPSIPHWDYFRYDVLPESLSTYRVAIERMMIRDWAELLKNKRGIDFLSISDYQLVNDKIDIR